MEHLLHIKAVLLCFAAMIGLKLNLAKNEIVPMGEADGLNDLARIF